MSRIGEKFKELKKKKEKAFIAFLTAGDPDLKVTESLVVELERRGVDIFELGVPFSDPLADGPTIQAASERALKNKVSLKDVLKLIKTLRSKVRVPLILFTYYNPVHRYGLEKFSRDAAKAGVDGVIVPDLPPEEGKELKGYMGEAGLDTIFLVAPTSTSKRIKLVAGNSTGFVYYVSLTGVTGARDGLMKTVEPALRKIRCFTKKPIAVGFGISNPQQVKEVVSFAEGVIVGSSIVKRIEDNLSDRNLVRQVAEFVERLVQASKTS
ncbi:MAG: tryptophan synthase subunit alpha [Nitrospirae bacterium]|nr:tryptophan synthase subunit alpha [Nitrospirota bacterium]